MKQQSATIKNKLNAIEKAKSSIKSDIINRILYPRQRLIETEIAAKLGMSRTPVREALKQLEVEGAVTRLPTRGLVVTAITADDIRHTFEVREALETMAIKLVCEKITDKALEKLRRYLENYQIVVNKSLQDNGATIDPYWSILFHTELYIACDNPKLISYIEGLRDIERLEYVKKYFKESELNLFYEQHDQILKSINKRDQEGAIESVKAHLATMCQIFLDYI